MLIEYTNVPVLQWSMGRVEEVHPVHDGIVQVATMQTILGLKKVSGTNYLSIAH